RALSRPPAVAARALVLGGRPVRAARRSAQQCADDDEGPARARAGRAAEYPSHPDRRRKPAGECKALRERAATVLRRRAARPAAAAVRPRAGGGGRRWPCGLGFSPAPPPLARRDAGSWGSTNPVSRHWWRA